MNAVAQTGAIEFISYVENATLLCDIWDSIYQARQSIGLPPKEVVLQPSFSPNLDWYVVFPLHFLIYLILLEGRVYYAY